MVKGQYEKAYRYTNGLESMRNASVKGKHLAFSAACESQFASCHFLQVFSAFIFL